MIEYKGKQVLISDILHDAADKFLQYNRNDQAPYRFMYNDGLSVQQETCDAERFSCCAVEAAIAYNFGIGRWVDDTKKLSKKVKQGLRAMGCPTGSSTAFSKYGDNNNWQFENHEVQGMRYMWLKWAAMMAEEQGV
jgi:hypothetical protein